MGNFMKKKTILFMLICAAVIFSCQKNDGPQVSQGGAPAKTTQGGAPAKPGPASGPLKKAFALRVGTGFYILESDTGKETDKAAWAAALNLGDSVQAGEARRATYGKDARVYDFLKVRDSAGKEGFVIASQIAVDGKLAVVIDEKANLYSSPRTIDVTGNILSRKTVAVFYPETENGGFVEIKAIDSESGVNRQGFIRLSSLSQKDADIQSSILLQTALTLKTDKEKARRDALLESAYKDYPDSVFNAEIEELRDSGGDEQGKS